MAKNQPMGNNNSDRLASSRRDFVRAAGGVVAMGAYARRGILPAFAADPVCNLDDLARSVRGRLLRRNSPGYDEARRVWNLAYDSPPARDRTRREPRGRATLRGVCTQAHSAHRHPGRRSQLCRLRG
jgi:hypothetical protein